MSSPSFPPLPDELVGFIADRGVSLLLGTCSRDLIPESVRCAGLRVWPGACHLTILVPKATGDIAVAHLRDTGRIAVAMSEIETLRSIQVKGSVLEIRDGAPEDEELASRYGALLRASLARVGLPEGVSRGLALWPAWSVDLEITQVYAQTPGPVAGVKMPVAPGVNVP